LLKKPNFIAESRSNSAGAEARRSFWCICGPTKVGPCYKAQPGRVFSASCKAVLFQGTSSRRLPAIFYVSGRISLDVPPAAGM
jgi:hypothetical protein